MKYHHPIQGLLVFAFYLFFQTTVPEVYIDQHSNLSDTINIGGSELFYIDIYVVPQTHHRMSVNIYAPWNSSFYGELTDIEIMDKSMTVSLS